MGDRQGWCLIGIIQVNYMILKYNLYWFITYADGLDPLNKKIQLKFFKIVNI